MEVRIKRGNIVLLSKVDLSVLGDSIQDYFRPWVVISNNANNNMCNTIQLAAVSSNILKEEYPQHAVIKNWMDCGLRYESVIFTEQIITVNKSKIDSIIGMVVGSGLEELNRALYIQLNLREEE